MNRNEFPKLLKKKWYVKQYFVIKKWIIYITIKAAFAFKSHYCALFKKIFKKWLFLRFNRKIIVAFLHIFDFSFISQFFFHLLISTSLLSNYLINWWFLIIRSFIDFNSSIILLGKRYYFDHLCRDHEIYTSVFK